MKNTHTVFAVCVFLTSYTAIRDEKKSFDLQKVKIAFFPVRKIRSNRFNDAMDTLFCQA